jgi:hypothetical protein
MHRATRIATLVLVAGLAACSGQSEPQEPQPETTLEVDNQARLDMNIYVVRGGGTRQRLGTATAHTRTTFVIPARLIFGLTPLRFQADPIGARRAPVSREITVEPGDRVSLIIPPG